MQTSWVPLDKTIYLFDVDGVTLQRTEPFSVRYEREIHEPGLLTTFFKGVFQECLIGKADLREEVSKRLKEWKWEGDVDTFLEYWFSAESDINDETIHIIQFLRSQGKKCYLVTNQEKYRTKFLTDKLDLDALADGFFSSSMLGVKKPDHAFYAHVLERIGFDGDLRTVFYVDDDIRNVSAAQQFGIDSFYYEA